MEPTGIVILYSLTRHYPVVPNTEYALHCTTYVIYFLHY